MSAPYRGWMVLVVLAAFIGLVLNIVACNEDSEVLDGGDAVDGECIECSEAEDCLDFAATHGIMLGLNGFPVCVEGISYDCRRPADSSCCPGTGKKAVVTGSCMPDGDADGDSIVDGDTPEDGDTPSDGDSPDGDTPDGDMELVEQDTVDGEQEDVPSDGDVPDGDLDADMEFDTDGDSEEEAPDPCQGECEQGEPSYCTNETTLCSCIDGQAQWMEIDCIEYCTDGKAGEESICRENPETGEDFCYCGP